MQPDVRSRSRVRAVPGLPDTAPHSRSRANAEAVAVLHRSAQVLLDHLPELTDRLVASLREQEPAYRASIEADPTEVWQEVHHSLRHNVGSLIRPRENRESARRYSRRIGELKAERGLPLDALLHAFRIGGAMVWQGLVEETARRRPDDVRLLVHVAADVWNFVDEHCTCVAEAYHRTQRQLAWSRENRLRLMTEALLDGTTRIADLPEVATALGLPEHGRYAVLCVARSLRPPVSVGGALPRPKLPGIRVIWRTGPDGEHGIALVDDGHGNGRGRGSGNAGRGGDRSRSSLPELARELSAPPGTRIGISSEVAGLSAVGDARRLAETALRICPEAGGSVLLDDHLPAALVVSSPSLGSALAQRVLGPLLQLEPPDRDVLLETLTVWLECDGSAPRAASRLYCHRNTVLNRLRRCEQLTDRSLARPDDLVELSLALSARRLLHG
ncbi:helix-turn-helix domain-containing protein [Streptomyces sp. N2-109]|uniref:Helix-turn-helix domain-containing protein n=1 Tax=Streptomyces gossypii TaxID=2883101 RepID=A0ABT2K4E8_9ACTN|nr:helix-turn-helix domain-containing protein [Streptomyces gossypii]MCT2594339.1 helix-turn-helix domain-containing protein [Streptomyces gossypii]